MTMTSASMITDPFPHLFYCAAVLLVDTMFYNILRQWIECSINPWIVGLAKALRTEKANSYPFAYPSSHSELKAVNLPPSDSQSPQGKCAISGAQYWPLLLAVGRGSS